MTLTFFPLLLISVLASPTEQKLDSVLAAMDKSNSDFRSMTAKLRKLTHTAVINDDSVESGTIRMKRYNSRSMRLFVEIVDPDPKMYSLTGRKAEIYMPKIRTVQEYDLGKDAQLVDQFLLLGFGTPSQQLAGSYMINLGGEEVVAGAKTARLELVPKSSKTREHLKKVEVWVSLADGRTVQQKFHEPSGDFRLFTYTDVQWNAPLADSAVKLPDLKGVKREYPQK